MGWLRRRERCAPRAPEAKLAAAAEALARGSGSAATAARREPGPAVWRRVRARHGEARAVVAQLRRHRQRLVVAADHGDRPRVRAADVDSVWPSLTAEPLLNGIVPKLDSGSTPPPRPPLGASSTHSADECDDVYCCVVSVRLAGGVVGEVRSATGLAPAREIDDADRVARVHAQRHGPRRARQHLDPGLVLRAARAAHRLLRARLDQVAAAHAADADPRRVDAERGCRRRTAGTVQVPVTAV